MRNKYNQTFIVKGLLVLAFVFFIIELFYSEGSIYGGDSYTHYLFARWAFNHPDNLLNHWAKPLFTLFAAPFAFWGFKGIMLFNITTCALSTYFTIAIAQKLKYKNRPILIFFSTFAPIYILIMFSGLTEAFFSLLLIASIYFFIDKKYLIATIIISFIPFVRSEGTLFIAWFFVLLILKKRFKFIPFLFAGVVLYSVLGKFISGDLLWLIHQNPYTTTGSVYGSGSGLFYFQNIQNSFGWISFIFAIIGIISIIYFQFIRKTETIDQDEIRFNEFFVIGSSAIIYFAFHSIVWAYGWLSVLGDVRFMAGIVPLIALLALNGFNISTKKIKNQKWIISIGTLIAATIIATSLQKHVLPVKIEGQDRAMVEAIKWIKNSGIPYPKIIFYNPIVPVITDEDPFCRSKMQEKVANADIPERDIPKNTILIWDNHFAANEGRLSRNSLIGNPNFQLLKEVNSDTNNEDLDQKNSISIFIRK